MVYWTLFQPWLIDVFHCVRPTLRILSTVGWLLSSLPLNVHLCVGNALLTTGTMMFRVFSGKLVRGMIREMIMLSKEVLQAGNSRSQGNAGSHEGLCSMFFLLTL